MIPKTLIVGLDEISAISMDNVKGVVSFLKLAGSAITLITIINFNENNMKLNELSEQFEMTQLNCCNKETG